jgi:hypothetical protein
MLADQLSPAHDNPEPLPFPITSFIVMATKPARRPPRLAGFAAWPVIIAVDFLRILPHTKS